MEAPSSTGAVAKAAARQRRLQLRQANIAAAARNAPQPGLGKLDPSLKRHTSVLIKLRSSLTSPTSLESIIKELGSLSLEKHLDELVSASVEGLAKAKTGADVQAGVEVVSALHQRFPDTYTPQLNAALLAGLKPPGPGAGAGMDKDQREKEEGARVTRQRGMLRVVAELELVGIIRGKEGIKGGGVGDISWGILKELLTADKDSLATSAPIAIAFAKHLGPLFLPPPSSANGTTAPDATNQHDFPSLAPAATAPANGPAPATDADEIVPRETKDKFRKLLLAYVDALARREVKASLDLQARDKRNHEAYIRSGEVFEDREKGYEKAVRAWERGWAAVTQLSELLGLPAPALPLLTATAATSVLSTGGSSFTQAGEGDFTGGPWADEEEKNFYEDLRELRGEVPGSVLGIKAEKKDDADKKAEVEKKDEVEEAEEAREAAEAAAVAREVDQLMAEVDQVTPADVNPVVAAAATPEPAAEALAAGPAAQLTALLARLPEASSRAAIDAIAVEFAFLNSKAARKRLAKYLASVNRNRHDILPYYARLVGTLDPFMPDLGRDLVGLLEDEFRYLQRKRQADLAETRAKNLKFLAELTKFNVTPLHSILHVFKVLLDDFAGPNIENLCTVLEGCGRFLLRTEASAAKMRGVVDIVRRKMAALPLDAFHTTVLENALYQCDPPERSAVAQKERSPMQLYLRQLFYHALTRNSRDKVLKLIRKLDWDDKMVVGKIYSAFTKVWKIKFSNVHLFAVLLHELGKWHPDFAIRVVDGVLENVRGGMEVNSFKMNQQRIATVKYLGELYIYRVIDSKVIFDTLWTIATFGHPEGRPSLEHPSEIDSPDDCFRIRMACVLLDTVGSCFDRGQSKVKLDQFLTFFQLYVLSKGTLPMDVEFMLSDTFEGVRPKMERFKTFAEAAVAVEAMAAEQAKLDRAGAPAPEVEAEAEAEAEDEDARRADLRGEEDELDLDAGQPREGAEPSSESESDESDSTASEGDDDDSDPEDEEEGRHVPDPGAPTEADEDEFNRELSRLMTASSAAADGRRVDRSLNDFGVPMAKRVQGQGAATKGDVSGAARRGEDGDGGAEGAGVGAGGGMQFRLLTKRGNKQQTVAMSIPMESAIAIRTLEKQRTDRLEQQALKRLVLDHEFRQESAAAVAEKQAMRDALARKGVGLKFVPGRQG